MSHRVTPRISKGMMTCAYPNAHLVAKHASFTRSEVRFVLRLALAGPFPDKSCGAVCLV